MSYRNQQIVVTIVTTVATDLLIMAAFHPTFLQGVAIGLLVYMLTAVWVMSVD